MSWSASVRRRAPRRLLALAAVGVVVTTAAAPGLATAAPVLKAGDGDGQRVLQSVAVEMAPDGTYTDVTGSTVSTSGGPDSTDEATTSNRSYSPDDVVADLPVRVLTAYRTADGSGTDLSDLDGHDGRVEIDLTVQNLTVRPENLTYDVNGTSRSQAALVGAPLTVVASTALDGVEASSVVTPAATRKGRTTNGVLSQAADGTTQVQWATILAPPQIGASATLTLVVDAKDFQAPDFDLSVQPGLVTDPSVGALVDAAFSPANSSEMKLQARTINLVGEVNTVLARAGETISKVRTTLDSSADTLGTKTVSDLRSSAVGVASSMRGLDGSVKSLGRDLSSSLKSTRSSALQQLLQTVRTLDTMLGDTSAKPHAAAVKGQGCAISVAAPQRSASVYGNIVEVAGQLSGFAHATDSCKTSLQQSILKSVGPSSPDAASCRSSDSVTCALYGARTHFGEISDKLVESGDHALEALEPMKIQQAVAAATDLDSKVTAVSTYADALTGSSGMSRQDPTYLQVGNALDAVRTAASDLRSAAASVHQTAIDSQAAAQGEASKMVVQNDDLAAELCNLQGDGTNGTLTADQVEKLRSYLVSQSCDGSTALSAPGKYRAPLGERIQGQADAWKTIVTATDPAVGPLAGPLDALDARILEVGAKLGDLGDSLQTHRSSSKQQIDDLVDGVTRLKESRTGVTASVTQVQTQYAKAMADVQAAFRKAADDAKSDVNGTVDPQIRQVTQSSAESRDKLGQMFDHSASGLTTAAGRIAANGAKTLNAQKRSFAGEQRAAGVRISGQVQNGLSSIAQGVTSSTRDMEAAGTLLRQDLTKVLLDLGDRKVNGSGLLGAMTTGAATSRSADYQLALATDKTTSYASVRSADIAGLLLRQAQSDAALQKAVELPAFRMDLPSGTDHRTVYTFHLGASQ